MCYAGKAAQFSEEVKEMLEKKYGHFLEEDSNGKRDLEKSFDDDVKQEVSDAIHEIRVKQLEALMNENAAAASDEQQENNSTTTSKLSSSVKSSSSRAQMIKQRSRAEVERRKREHEEKQKKPQSWVKVVSRY